MSQDRTKQKKPDWGGSLWGPLFFFASGLLCLYAPEEMLSDPGWDSIPNKTNFGFACGAIFCGGGIVFHADGYWRPKGYHKVSMCGQLLGVSLVLAGFAYVLWTTGFPWS